MLKELLKIMKNKPNEEFLVNMPINSERVTWFFFNEEAIEQKANVGRVIYSFDANFCPAGEANTRS